MKAIPGQPKPKAPIETAILRAVAYADIFDYPLTVLEIHRYLVGVAASLADVETELTDGRVVGRRLAQRDDYFMLPGREEIVLVRQRRAKISRILWPQAVEFGQYIARLPFVRMVAVTGSLAMNNTDAGADVDCMVVTENGRVWVARAFIIALVKLARRKGIELCPNFILAENAILFTDHNLYMAHEVAQMIPLSGLELYREIRRINSWTADYLPNAAGPPQIIDQLRPGFWQKALELPLSTPVGNWLENWEMNRKIHKFNALETPDSETDFSADYCKGHFDAYKRPTMNAYQSTFEKYFPQANNC